jgi:hypothetical protein
LTGAAKRSPENPLRETIDSIISEWLAEHPRDGYELVLAHTHGHHDHVAGDDQFAERPATNLVGRELSAVQEFFGFTAWPDQTVRFDLGAGRSRSSERPVISARRSPLSTRGAGFCFLATTSGRAESTPSTFLHTWTASNARSSSPPRAESAM